MKSAMKYMIGALAGVGMYMVYEKYSPMIMKDMKKVVDSVEDMMNCDNSCTENEKK